MTELGIGSGTGWVPEKAHVRAAGLVSSQTRLRTSTFVLLPSAGIDYEPWVLNQGNTNACTGHGGAELIYGLTGKKTSPWMPWTFGRLVDGVPADKLTNTGVRTSSVVTALRDYGSCDWEKWRPGVEGFDYHSLPPAYLREQAQKYNVDVVSVYLTGKSLVNTVVDALGKKRPVCLSIEIDRLYRDAGGDPIGPMTEGSGDFHFITIWRCYKKDDNDYIFDSVSSWGKNHGDGGIVRLSSARLGQSHFGCFARGVS